MTSDIDWKVGDERLFDDPIFDDKAAQKVLAYFIGNNVLIYQFHKANPSWGRGWRFYWNLVNLNHSGVPQTHLHRSELDDAEYFDGWIYFQMRFATEDKIAFKRVR